MHKPHHKTLARRLLSVILLLSLAACFQAPESQTGGVERRTFAFDQLQTLGNQSIVSGNGITLTFEKTADWDAGHGVRGFTANLTILNQTGKALDDWDLSFGFLATISHMWNARYTQGGTRYTVTPEPWNARIEHNQSRSFGFQGIYSEVFQAPSAYVLSGIPIGDQRPPQPVVPDCRLDTRFVVTADWTNGDGSRGFVAEIYLTNVGVHPVNWQLTFDLAANITNLWNAGYTRDGGRYTVTPASWNTRIEPNQTLSFGFQGSYAGTLGEPGNVQCHGTSSDDAEYMRRVEQRRAEAYAELTERGRQLLAEGRLVWDGYDYVLPTSLFWPGRYRQPAGLSIQAAQDEFPCPLERTDKPPYQERDWGTFLLYASVPGTSARPLNYVSGSFVLPPSAAMSEAQRNNTGTQRPYVMFAGWGDQQGGGAFDAGLAWQGSGWSMATNRWVGDPAEGEMTYVGRLQRLRNVDANGNLIDDSLNTEPYTVDIRVEVTEDNKIRLVVQPTGNTVWVDPHARPIRQYRDPVTREPLALELGGDEVLTPNRGNIDEATGQPRLFPEQVVPGMRADGIDNRFSLQINVASDRDGNLRRIGEEAVRSINQGAPAEGTRVPGIKVYNLKVGSTDRNTEYSWDVSDPNDPIYGYERKCPSDNWENAYVIHGGSTTATDKDGAFTVDIDIKVANVHGCLNASGRLEPCPSDEPIVTTLSIDPPGLSGGAVHTEYCFTLTATGIPAGLSTVTFAWNFGDGRANSTGSRSEAVTNRNAGTVICHTYVSASAYGLVGAVNDGAGTLADASVVVVIGEVQEREEQLNICDVWKAAQSGGYGATVDNWDISAIPSGATFDIRFDAYSIPDKFMVEYPAGSIVLNTGWRGDSEYAGDPLYPGGIAGPGQGEVLGVFTKAAINSFKVTVIGPDPRTAWEYDIRCRIP